MTYGNLFGSFLCLFLVIWAIWTIIRQRVENPLRSDFLNIGIKKLDKIEFWVSVVVIVCTIVVAVIAGVISVVHLFFPQIKGAEEVFMKSLGWLREVMDKKM